MPKTIEKYTNERQELLQKLFSILEINEGNKMLSLKKLDEDEQKQKQILDLVDDIKKYFLSSRWTFFSHKNIELKRNYLSLIKAIMKDMNIKMVASFLHIPISKNKVKIETYYIFDF
jgi:hypothetical protein